VVDLNESSQKVAEFVASACEWRGRRPAGRVVQISIRMSLGTRQALAMSKRILNTRRGSEPRWSLGEVIELSIDFAYASWVTMREQMTKQDIDEASPKRRRGTRKAEAAHVVGPAARPLENQDAASASVAG
jgi:hypothetical protein